MQTIFWTNKHKCKTKWISIQSISWPNSIPQTCRVLQHLTFTISYIYYVIQHVRFFMSDQLTRHMWIIHYIKGTLSFSWHLSPSFVDKLVRYIYVGWSGWPDARRSKSRYCIYLGYNLILVCKMTTNFVSIQCWNLALWCC